MFSFKKVIPFVFSAIISMSGYSQRSSLEFTFTAIDNATYVHLDSIKVKNRNHGNEKVIYWPDTILTYVITPGDTLLLIGYSTGFPVGVQEADQEKKKFQLSQNFPNPVNEQCLISIYIPEKGTINVMIIDISGKVMICSDFQLDQGNHSFRFTPGDGNIYFFTTRWNGISRSIKILSTGLNSGKSFFLDYAGNDEKKPPLKTALLQNDLIMQESGILDSPNTSKTYIFQFATNIPCPGTPTVNYEGQVYNTIQIFSQCWLKENMNAGIMISSFTGMQNNGITEKYCYKNIEDNCTQYGGLYRWGETMQYTLQQGTRGICPPDWHIPTDEEWRVLEGAVDSLYNIGDAEWDTEGLRGYDAGRNLKTTNGWYSWDDKNYRGADAYTNLKTDMGYYDNGNGTDSFGFSGLPGGYCDAAGYFSDNTFYGYYWTSSQYTNQYGPAWHRCLSYHDPKMIREDEFKEMSNNVRCIRDY